MSIKVVTFFFFPPVINVFQFPFLIIIKVVTHLFLSCFICFTCSLLSSSRLSRNFLFPFFHDFLTIPFHEYQGCHVFFFSCYQHFSITLFYYHQGYHAFVSLFCHFLSPVLFCHHQGHRAIFSFLFFILL